MNPRPTGGCVAVCNRGFPSRGSWRGTRLMRCRPLASAIYKRRRNQPYPTCRGWRPRHPAIPDPQTAAQSMRKSKKPSSKRKVARTCATEGVCVTLNIPLVSTRLTFLQAFSLYDAYSSTCCAGAPSRREPFLISTTVSKRATNGRPYN